MSWPNDWFNKVFDNKINFGMITIIDYRNGRYQGQVLNQKPHGVGVFMSVNLTLIFSEWIRGQMSGSTIIIYPDGSTFYG